MRRGPSASPMTTPTSRGVGRRRARVRRGVARGSDDDDAAALALRQSRGHRGDLHGARRRRARRRRHRPPLPAVAGAVSRGRADAWVVQATRRRRRLDYASAPSGHEARRRPSPPQADGVSGPPVPERVSRRDRRRLIDFLAVDARGGPCRSGSSRPSAGSPRAPARDQLSAPKKSPTTGAAADLQARLRDPGSPASPDRKQGSVDLQARLRKLPGSPAGRPAHKRGSDQVCKRASCKLQAAADRSVLSPTTRSPTRPSSSPSRRPTRPTCRRASCGAATLDRRIARHLPTRPCSGKN